MTVTVTAEEGIIPEGTELTVTEVTDQVQEAVIEKTASDEEADTNVTAVIAYDINLMLDGKKLNNDWGQSHHVNVKFSGERIEQLSKEADTLQVATLETPTETAEAAFFSEPKKCRWQMGPPQTISRSMQKAEKVLMLQAKLLWRQWSLRRDILPLLHY